MSEKSQQHQNHDDPSFSQLEEEKRLFDQEIDEVERKITAQLEKESKEKEGNMVAVDEQCKTIDDWLRMIELDLELAESSLMSRFEKKKEYLTKMQYLQDKKQRKWLVKRGKSYLLDFQDGQIKKLKDCFNSLDGDGSGSIGIEELEEPLIGLGFADNRDEVQEMIDTVDADGSGMIEFPEFLSIIKNSDANEKTQKINKFFKDMTTGKLAQNDLSFNLLVQKLRRGYLMEAIMSTDPKKKEFGDKILKNVGRQVQASKFKKKTNW